MSAPCKHHCGLASSLQGLWVSLVCDGISLRKPETDQKESFFTWCLIDSSESDGRIWVPAAQLTSKVLFLSSI